MDPKIQTIGVVRFRGALKGGANGEKTGQAQCRVEGKVPLEALKGVKMVNELAGQYQVHLTQISQWKRQVQLGAREFFGTARTKGDQEHEKV